MAKRKRLVARTVLAVFGVAMMVGGAMLTPAGLGTLPIHAIFAGLGLAMGGCFLWEAFTNDGVLL